jgi:hypothetical protein
MSSGNNWDSVPGTTNGQSRWQQWDEAEKGLLKIPKSSSTGPTDTESRADACRAKFKIADCRACHVLGLLTQDEGRVRVDRYELLGTPNHDTSITQQARL